MRDTRAKQNWESENVVSITISINRHQDPELFELLKVADSKSQAARELMQKAIERRIADVQRACAD